MKKFFSLIIACLMFAGTGWAQDGLPVAGNYSIGFNAPGLLNNPQTENVLIGTILKSDYLAYRGKLGFNMSLFSPGDSNRPSTSSTNISLMGGLMNLRRAYKFLGYYGAEAGLGIGSSKSQTSSGSESKSSNTSIIARGFVGAQCFILPQFSIGAEYGLGLMLRSEKTNDLEKDSRTSLGNDNSGGQITLSVYF
jgi:hypothetical protein